jgi:hypothetical protein
MDVNFIKYSRNALYNNNIGYHKDNACITEFIGYLTHKNEINFDILNKYSDKYDLETCILPYIKRNINDVPKILGFLTNKNPQYTDEESENIMKSEDPICKFLNDTGSGGTLGPISLPYTKIQEIVKNPLKVPELDPSIISTLKQLNIPIPECKWYLHKIAY